jgi:Transposase DNA-binding/Transposase Tn5 dimerisation domain
VPRASRLEYSDVQAVIDAGTHEVDWVSQELEGVDLSDERLDRRLIKTAQQLARSPVSPINEACGDWASTQAAYRLFDNGKASPRAILEPHINKTLQRMADCEGPVLSVQDTVFISYSRHSKTKGLGPVGKSSSADERGLVMHNAVAFTTAGVPLGVLSQSIWARDEVPQEGYQEKIERLQVTVIEKKESFKWLLALRETVARTPRGVKVITVADRESDCFEFITEAREHRASFLVRARTNRTLVAEDSEGYDSILEALGAAPVLGTLSVEIPSNGKRKARTASVAVCVAHVTIKPPQRRGKAKTSGSTEPIILDVIAATETHPPPGVEAISWVLLTNLPVNDFTGATEKIEWYGLRWGIETWHKVLKSGCAVEDCRLENADRLGRHLALFSIIAVRLMYVTYLARAQPELPATGLFSKEELDALHIRVHKTPTPTQPPSLREAVRMIGRLGGHLGRKGDGEPGVTVLWRGWASMYETIEALRAYKQSQGLSSSS